MTQLPELITAAEVNKLLPGGLSISQEQVNAICEQIRHECGWHIAPSITETMVLDSEGTDLLRLPTLHMTALSEVRHTASGDPIPVDTVTGWSEAGLLTLSGTGFVPGRSWASATRPGSGSRFPAGFRAVTVTFSHGFQTCPLDLVKFIAQTTRQRIVSETLVGRAVTFGQDQDLLGGSITLDKYRLVFDL